MRVKWLVCGSGQIEHDRLTLTGPAAIRRGARRAIQGACSALARMPAGTHIAPIGPATDSVAPLRRPGAPPCPRRPAARRGWGRCQFGAGQYPL